MPRRGIHPSHRDSPPKCRDLPNPNRDARPNPNRSGNPNSRQSTPNRYSSPNTLEPNNSPGREKPSPLQLVPRVGPPERSYIQVQLAEAAELGLEAPTQPSGPRSDFGVCHPD